MKKYFILSFALFALLLAPNVHAATVSAGDLIKTDESSAVYLLTDDGKRAVFPDEKTYKTWYSDYDDVKVISKDNMAELPIGEMVKYQAGMQLITTPSTHDVYAVEPGGDLRHIPDEATAIRLYGDEWSDRVMDVSDIFITQYDRGLPPLEGEELPEGMLFNDDDGDLFRWTDGMAVEIDDMISEEKEKMFEVLAMDLEIMKKEMLKEFDFAMEEREFDGDTMGIFFDEIAMHMKTVFVEEFDKMMEFDFEVLNHGQFEYDEDDMDGDECEVELSCLE